MCNNDGLRKKEVMRLYVIIIEDILKGKETE